MRCNSHFFLSSQSVAFRVLGAGLAVAFSAAMAAPGVAFAQSASAASAQAQAETPYTDASGLVGVFRMYNPNSGEHLYTLSKQERISLIAAGWTPEGIGWFAPSTGTTVYRLYNPYEYMHLYTSDTQERDRLVGLGWHLDDVRVISGGDKQMYRERNPYGYANRYNWTCDKAEHDNLVGLGYVAEDATGFMYEKAGINQSALDKLEGTSYASLSHTPKQADANKIREGSLAYFRDRGDRAAVDALLNCTYKKYTHIGNAADATRIEYMRQSFKFIRFCNELRKKHGLSEFKVTRLLMAQAQANANASAITYNHTRQFTVGENLAWGYSQPFDGWYTEERAIYLKDRGASGQVGHYLNIINPQYETTGFAISQYCDGCNGDVCSQVFNFGASDAMTVDELEADFNCWLKEISYTK